MKLRRLEWIIADIDKIAAGLSSTQSIVLLLLAHHAGRKEVCFPSIETLTRKGGIGSDKTVRVALAELAKRQLVQIEHGGQHRPNRYTLQRSALEVLPRFQPGSGYRSDDERQLGNGNRSDSSQPGSGYRSDGVAPEETRPVMVTARPVIATVQTGSGYPLTSQERINNGSGESAREDAPAPATPQSRKAPEHESSESTPSRHSMPVPAVTPKRALANARGTRLPESWEPKPETLERFRTKELVDASVCVERFKNHWLASNGRNATKRDWDRAFINWVIEDVARGRSVPARRTPAVTVGHASEREPTAAERAESDRILREARTKLDAKLENDRQFFEGGSLAARG